MKCTQCQKENPIDTLFCPSCGANQNTTIEVKEFQPLVEIYRESSMVGFLFNYKIFIDGIEVGEIANGEKKKFPLSFGLHEVHLKMNWSWQSSPKVSFFLKDFTKLTCKPAYGILGMMLGVKPIIYFLFKPKKFIRLINIRRKNEIVPKDINL